MKHILGVYLDGKLYKKVNLEDYPDFFTGKPVTIGRRENNDIVIPKDIVSREHAALYYENGRVVIRDLGSLNKLTVKGKTHEAFKLKSDMQFCIGSEDNSGSVVFIYKEIGISSESEAPKREKSESGAAVKAAEEKVSEVKYKIRENMKPAEEISAEKPSKVTMLRRLLAFMADFAVCMFMCVGFCGPLIIWKGVGGIFKFIIVLGVLLIFWMYFAFGESSENGATVGKSILSVKVTDNKGRSIGFGRATFRLIAKFFSLFTLFLPVFGKGRCLHDLLSGTVVVRK